MSASGAYRMCSRRQWVMSQLEYKTSATRAALVACHRSTGARSQGLRSAVRAARADPRRSLVMAYPLQAHGRIRVRKES